MNKKKYSPAHITDQAQRIDAIQQAVCVDFQLYRHQLLGRYRQDKIRKAKYIGIYLAKLLGGASNEAIAQAFNYADGLTIPKLVQKIKAELKQDAALRERLLTSGKRASALYHQSFTAKRASTNG